MQNQKIIRTYTTHIDLHQNKINIRVEFEDERKIMKMLLKVLHRSILAKNGLLRPICKNYNIISIYSFSTTEKTQKIDTVVSNNLPVPVSNWFNSMKESVGLQGRYRYKQNQMAAAGVYLYLCIQKQIDFKQFFQICNSRDVYVSFCLVTFLHVWMVCVRLAEEGQSGKFVRNRLIEAMYNDIGERVKKLGKIDIKVKVTAAEELNGIFNACFLGYDEGILSDDIVLSACLWRHLLEMRDIEDFSVFNTLCEYVRKNVVHLDTIKEVDLLKNGIVTLIPLGKDTIDQEKEREKLLNYVTIKD